MSESTEEKIISTNKLKMSDVPSGRINWSKISAFARTFDPRSEDLKSDEMTQFSESAPRPEHDLKVLRAFLYNCQRIQNNKTYEPSSEFLYRAQEVIGWIREKIRANS